jgi:predicted amidohydrolase
MEFPTESEVISNLGNLVKDFPTAQLLVLSEYTLEGPVPAKLKEWCRENGKYLIVGGKDPTPDNTYYDTAFVIGPTGKVVFKQAKSVPLQFFDDGLPAEAQRVWDSPWGKIGICICYDLSYTRVTDGLIRLGAQALIVPTMDMERWGRHEHELHRRVALARAAEYGVPIFRVGSSGISQSVNCFGGEDSTAPFPGEGATIAAKLGIGPAGRLPLDRALAPLSVVITAAFIAWLAVSNLPQVRGCRFATSGSKAVP